MQVLIIKDDFSVSDNDGALADLLVSITFSPVSSRLRVLHLPVDEPEDGILTGLLQSPPLSSVEELRLCSVLNELVGEVVDVVEHGFLPHLRILAIPGADRMRPMGMIQQQQQYQPIKRLMEAINNNSAICRHLRVLNLPYINEIEGWVEVAKVLPVRLGIEELHLGKIEAEGAKALALALDGGALPQLRRLVIGHNRLDGSAFGDLIRSLRRRKHCHVKLEVNGQCFSIKT